MRQYFFTLNVSYLQCEQLYEPGRNVAIMTADSGERVQLPIVNLRPYTTKDGIQGKFKMVVSDQNKIISFDKVR
ncbi:DUF2835 family protein [Alteromonadaceae bacterium M269]|nr:DUF2835 family protein [Alteromonadaceae bacterium M269]